MHHSRFSHKLDNKREKIFGYDDVLNFLLKLTKNPVP